MKGYLILFASAYRVKSEKSLDGLIFATEQRITKSLRLVMQQTVLDNLTTGIITLNERLQVLYLNNAAEALLDISFKRAELTPVTDFIRQQELLTDLERALERNHRFSRREIDCHFNDEAITVDYTVTPVFEDGVTLLLEIVPRERVHRISREEALVAQQETSKILVRGLAHEVKNPLGGIRGAAQLLDRELQEPFLNEFTSIIIKEADRLRDLVDRMLGPLQPARMTDQNIHEVLERVIQLVKAETGERISINRDYDPSIPNFPGDGERLIQAVLNLVRNAMQAIESAMPLEKGVIQLKTRIVRQFTIGVHACRLVCHVAVIDNGAGIPAHLRNNIFYPMVSGRAGGSGLGLPLAQSIVSEHHGLIECESSPGRTVFNMYIPITQDDGEPNADK